MLRVLIAGSTEDCLAISQNLKWDKLDCEVVGQTQNGEETINKALLMNVDAIIADYDLHGCDGLTLLRKIREHTEETQVILCIGREKFIQVGTELKNSGAEYILKPIASGELEHIATLLKKYKDGKRTTEYLSFVLTEKKFEDEVLRNLIKSNTEYFDGVFKNITAAERDTIVVKFACVKMINIAYEYFERLGFKRVKVQKNTASKRILELKNITEIIEYTRSQYMNIMQFDGKKNASFYISIVEKIKEYIDENYQSSELCMSKISALFHFSPNYINDIFKTQAGLSIPKYILEVRMNKARELLITTEMSVKNVALSVGYDKTNYFPRIFKNRFNASPMEYRHKFGKQRQISGKKH